MELVAVLHGSGNGRANGRDQLPVGPDELAAAAPGALIQAMLGPPWFWSRIRAG